MTVEQARALLARVEAASGRDRQLDHDLTAAFYPDEQLQWPDQYMAAQEHWRKRPVEHLTTSIDAALALVEGVRKAHDLTQEWSRSILERAIIRAWNWCRVRKNISFDDWRTLLPLAIIAALLRSEIARLEGEGR